ncbi:carboxymuconolactone decarboxylase family protein [Amycolatopsis sp. GM8]|uniref:carboxymuconolactone decarboxylase family protein n=1 Tax=Amycolatopsis sp. GM8 TaxID=2896530 RepID=UPI001F253532|nr:carboxymuconolactone decarboxylase family protein [Amycolatopsis sp. GM8]
MPRIEGISDTRAGPAVRLVYHFTRRGLTRLSDQAPEAMLDPLRLYAHLPGLLFGYAALETATGRLKRLDRRLRALAELKAANLVACAYCIDLGSVVARRWGLADAEVGALAAYQDSPLFTELEKRVLDYAAGMCRTPAHVPDEVFAALRAHLTDAQLVELTHVIALENLRSRFNIGLGIGAAGFVTEGERS